MSLDVSIYNLREKTGYLNTVAGGTANPIGTNSYSAATTGGSGTVSGVVYTTKDQIVQGLKVFDNSTYFNYDVSIGGNIFLRGLDISTWIDHVDASLNEIPSNVLTDSSLNPSYFEWNGGLLEPSIATSTSLAQLTDVSLGTLNNLDVLSYRTLDSKWGNNESVPASNYFQLIPSFATKGSSDTGTQGQWSFDASYLYLCTSTNIWKRILLEGGY